MSCKTGQVEWGVVMDTTDDYRDVEGAYLPHSCDAWVIGDLEAIRALIADLNLILDSRTGGSR